MKKAKLVVIGDSLSQGFMSGAVYRTDISFPALIAKRLEEGNSFSYPTFNEQYGLPCNLEILLRNLTDKYGSKINLTEMIPLVKTTLDFLKKTADFWDNEGRYMPRCRNFPYSNQAIWGFKVEDADTVTGEMAANFLKQHPPGDNSFFNISQIPFYITVKKVLNPFLTAQEAKLTQIDNIRIISQQRGIENLIFWLGANNALGAVAGLKIELSTAETLDNFPHETKANLYYPEHFEVIYRRVANKLQEVQAERIFVGTIPHVTIPPVTRGVSFNKEDPCPEGYFEYYTRPWIWDSEFRPNKHPHLTRAQAKMIDQYIDQYNQIIKQVAAEKGWYVVDICKLLDNIAYRRCRGQVKADLPKGLGEALARNPLTTHLVDERGKIKLDTRYLSIDATSFPKVVKGGLFSLDGIHPTTIGYGLIADAFLTVMIQAGVKIHRDLDWDFIVASDTLVTNPPAIMSGLREMFIFLRNVKILNFNLLEILIEKIRGNGG